MIAAGSVRCEFWEHYARYAKEGAAARLYTEDREAFRVLEDGPCPFVYLGVQRFGFVVFRRHDDADLFPVFIGDDGFTAWIVFLKHFADRVFKSVRRNMISS